MESKVKFATKLITSLIIDAVCVFGLSQLIPHMMYAIQNNEMVSIGLYTFILIIIIETFWWSPFSNKEDKDNVD